LELKRRFGLFDAPPANGQFDQAGNQALARRLALQAITLHGQANAPLVSADRVLLVTPNVLPVGSTQGDGYSLLGELLRARGIEVDEWIFSLDDPGDIATRQSQALQALANYPVGIVVTLDASQPGGGAQAAMARALQSGNKPVILVAAGSPYDLSLVQPGGVGLATYGALDYQIDALVEALFAPTLPAGKLPVALPAQ
jgi:beta-N-acetylhexosaminidase